MASSLFFFLSLYVLLPALLRIGASRFASFNLTLVLPMVLLTAATLVACRHEGVAFTWRALRDRLRLNRPNQSAWLWTAALSAFMYGGRWAMGLAFALALVSATVEGEGQGAHPRLWRWAVGLIVFFALSWTLWQTGPWLKLVSLHQQPDHIREFLSRFGPTDFMGIPLPGQWWVVLYYLVILLLGNVAGEELWWRGFLLPRQEMAHGSVAWVFHGVLWAAFHIFFQWTLWDLVRMVPTCCALSFVAQHERNTWPGIVAHTFANSPIVFQLVRGVMG